MYLLCVINHRGDIHPPLDYICCCKGKNTPVHVSFHLHFFQSVFPSLYFMVFDHRGFSIHSLLNLTQRGCLYLLCPNNADHAIEQCNQFVQQELVFHFLHVVQKIKQLHCAFQLIVITKPEQKLLLTMVMKNR